MFVSTSTVLLAATAFTSIATCTPSPSHGLRVETHVNGGLSFNMISSLIIGSEAAVLIDLPLAVPQAKELAAWVRKTTSKPLAAVFTTHFHPDHYLSGGAFLASFPSTKYYANSKVIEHIKAEAPVQVKSWQKNVGVENITTKTAIPTPYDFSFFTLPGDESTPIELLGILGGDTVDETLFWIPSIKTLITGDIVYDSNMHLWLADMRTHALTSSWITSLDFVASLKPAIIVSGHALTDSGATCTQNLDHSRKYLTFWQKEIESKGSDFYTPQQIEAKFNAQFPGRLGNLVSATLLNITAEQFGKGGVRQYRGINLNSYTDVATLEGWKM